MEELELRCHRSFAGRCFEFYGFITDPSRKGDEAYRVVDGFHTKKHNRVTVAPVAFRLNEREAQQLMDDLYRCGVRPTEGSGSAGAMAKIENHLKDLRAITFKKLGMEPPQ